MKRILEFFTEIIDSKLSRVFFVANLVVCFAAFDWSAGFSYFEKIHETVCKPKLRISFGMYDMYGGSLEIIDMLALLLCVVIVLLISLFFLAPSALFCGLIIELLKVTHPGWCAETFDLITIPIFMITNGIYWTILGWGIESIYLESIQYSPTKKHPLSILSS